MPETVEVRDINVVLDGGIGLPLTIRPGDELIHDVEDLQVELTDGRQYCIRQSKILYLEYLPVRREVIGTSNKSLPPKAVDMMLGLRK